MRKALSGVERGGDRAGHFKVNDHSSFVEMLKNLQLKLYWPGIELNH